MFGVRLADAGLRERGTRARVHGHEHRQRRLRQRGDDVREPLGVVGVLGAVDRREHVLARLAGRSARRTARSLDALDVAQQRLGHDVADEVHARRVDALAREVRRARPRSGASSIEESWSVTRRLTSSGIDMSPERRPASRCTTGICSFAAASAPASVEFTSPTTSTASGALGGEELLEPHHRGAGLHGVRAGADAEQPRRAPAISRSAKKTSDIVAS